MAVDRKWDAKKGLYVRMDGSELVNDEPALSTDIGDVEDNYFSYLAKAHDAAKPGAKPPYDFSVWNAKKLVWDSGNQRSLSAIRARISLFSKRLNKKFDTLKSGNKKSGKTAAQQKAEDDKIFAKHNLDRFAP